jgi:hypothetical protein
MEKNKRLFKDGKLLPNVGELIVQYCRQAVTSLNGNDMARHLFMPNYEPDYKSFKNFCSL